MCDFLKNTDEIVQSVEKRYIYNESLNCNDYINFEDESNDCFIQDETIYELSEDEKTNENKNKKNILPFTKTLKILKNIKLETEYKKWLECNSELVKSAYYIIKSKYLNDVNINNVTLEEFSIFCFLSN